MAADLAKYVTADDPCPFCGEAGTIDSRYEDTESSGPDGQYESREKWYCDTCEAQWEAVFVFQRLVPDDRTRQLTAGKED